MAVENGTCHIRYILGGKSYGRKQLSLRYHDIVILVCRVRIAAAFICAHTPETP